MTQHTVILDEMELEMILNSMNYEYQNRTELDSDYRSRLHDLFMWLDDFTE